MKRTIKILVFVAVIVAGYSANSQQLAIQDFNKVSASLYSITKSFEKKYVMAPALPQHREFSHHNQFITAKNYTRNLKTF